MKNIYLHLYFLPKHTNCSDIEGSPWDKRIVAIGLRSLQDSKGKTSN